jgi:IS30 family transposase
VCHEASNQALYQRGKSGLRRQLTRRLRTGRPLRRRWRRPDERRARFISPPTLIDHRPAVVLEQSRCGGWEGVLIVGGASRSAIGTLVEQASRWLLLVHVPINGSAGRDARCPDRRARPPPAVSFEGHWWRARRI